MSGKLGKKSGGAGWSPAPRRKRKGVHAKRRNSKLKQSKNYKKRYRGQGRGWRSAGVWRRGRSRRSA